MPKWPSCSVPSRPPGHGPSSSATTASSTPSAPAAPSKRWPRRHPGHVFALTENVRQRDPAERHALDQLRAGEVPMAAAWYVLNGRVHPAPTRGQAMLDMVRAWAYDVVEGKDALLVAYHRDAVESTQRGRPPGVGGAGPPFRPRAGGRGREALPGRRPGGHPLPRAGTVPGSPRSGPWSARSTRRPVR